MPRDLLPLRLSPDRVRDERRLFLDIESSGLHEGSFPIELALSDDGLEVRSWLIRPHDDWRLEDWSAQAELVHGISWERLRIEGKAVERVAAEVASACAGRIVVSDAVGHDGLWIDRLFAAAGLGRLVSLHDYLDDLALKTVGALDPDEFFEVTQRAYELCDLHFPHTHVAGDDARCLAAFHRMVTDGEFLAAVNRLGAPSKGNAAPEAGTAL